MSANPPAPASPDPALTAPFPIYAATAGHVLALNALDGVELWRRKLPDISSGVISIMVLGDDLYAAAYGHVYGLNRHTGEILWKNDLKGLGYSPVTLGCEGVGSTFPIVAAAAAQQTASEGSFA